MLLRDRPFDPCHKPRAVHPPSDNLAPDAILAGSRRDLEWHELLEGLASLCHGELGADRLRRLEPATDEAEARRRSVLVREAVSLGELGAAIPALDPPDVTHCMERLRRDGVASAAELHGIAQLLRAALELEEYLRRHAEAAPHLAESLVVASVLRDLHREIARVLEDDGRIADRASPELAAARRQVTDLRAQMKVRLGELIRRYREALQDGYFAERDGRYVLPVRADAPFRVEGIVLDSSASGATLYVEPRELAQLGNRLKIAEAESEHQEAIVLARLSAELGPHADQVLDALEACSRADVLRALVRFASSTGARVVDFGEAGSLRLEAARHPLMALRGEEVVPNDLELLAGHGLVLSGPNAGGKTVALKCLGLAALMQKSGLPVVAGPRSSVGFFEEVLSDIGDDQSLAKSLSTFSGHIERVRELLDRSRRGVLVLLDELAGGTDPEEGASLAVATLEELVRRGAAVAVTTHYERLKELGQNSEGIDNAAVGFDFERLAPTFRLELGIPGASSALAVARRHGLPEGVVARAERLVPEGSKHREATLRDLDRQRIELERLRREAEEERDRQVLLRRQIEEELRKQKERERKELSRKGQELSSAIREARAEVLRAQQVLKRRAQAAETIRETERVVDQASRLLAVGGQLDETVRHAPAAPVPESKLVAGANVRVLGLGTIAEVLGPPDKGQVRVRAGVMKMSVPVARIELVTGGTPAARSGPQKQKPRRSLLEQERERPSPPRTQDTTLDLRGERVEEALDRVDEFLDQLLRRGEPAGFVLHGHGTGALKAAVRQHLRAHVLVSDSRPAERDEGGDAFTVFWLTE